MRRDNLNIIVNSSTRLLNSCFNKRQYELRKQRMIMRDAKIYQKQRIEEELERTRHHYLPSGSPRSRDSTHDLSGTLTSEVPKANSMVQQSSGMIGISSENKPTTVLEVKNDALVTLNSSSQEAKGKEVL